MNRRQRQAHARLWPLLLALMAAVCVGALIAKAHIDEAQLEARF